ncbi:MAG: hypothetical protein IKQ36_10650 [Clostridia bacterium]|nr:hypothetical protein [Clostridia bacterium]
MTIAQTPLKPGSHSTDVILDNGKKVVNTYDAIGRITSKALKNGNSTILNTEVSITVFRQKKSEY